MIKHFLLTAWRNIKRNKLLSIIQIFCLTLGLATFTLIFRYVQYEKNWDKFNVKFERIYRAQLSWKDGRDDSSIKQTDPVLAGYLKDNYPEIEEAIVMREVWGGYLSTSPEKTFYEEEGYYAPNEVFDLFSFKLISGNKNNALTDPYSVILSKKLADKYFPGENAMGKTIFDDRNIEYQVTGIMQDVPEDSHIRPDYFFSISSRSDWDMTSWGNKSYRTYVLLREGSSAEQFNARIKNLIDEHEESNKYFLYLKPLSELHLNPNDIKDFIVVIIFYAIIGVLILLLASLNFANLTTAFSISRAKEIGIRKVNGGSVGSLRKQFLYESVLLAFISMIFAVFMAWICLPFFNNVVERSLTFNFFSNPMFLGVIMGATLVTGIVSGVYPALLLSSFRPAVILKGNNPLAKTRGKISGLKALVTIQFAITVILIVTTVWIFRQTEHLKNKNLGFDKSALFHSTIPGNTSDKEYRNLRSQVLEINGVENVCMSKNSPFHSNWGRGISLEGAAPDEWFSFNYNEVSPDFIETYGIKLVEGRFFSETQKSDEKTVVINETGAKIFGEQSAIGKRLKVNNEWFTVLGVIKDFNVNSVMWNIGPYIMLPHKGDIQSGNEFTFKLDGTDNQATVASLDNLFRETFPNSIFTISYFDDRADNEEVSIWQSVGKTFIFFTILAILIAAVGLFGMVAYTTRKRIKEIGIRRIQGAKTTDIFMLVVKEFLYLLFFANAFVLPIPFILKNTTPGNYKYQMEVWEIAAIIGFSFIIAILSSSYEALKAANLNPAKSLRYE